MKTKAIAAVAVTCMALAGCGASSKGTVAQTGASTPAKTSPTRPFPARPDAPTVLPYNPSAPTLATGIQDVGQAPWSQMEFGVANQYDDSYQQG